MSDIAGLHISELITPLQGLIRAGCDEAGRGCLAGPVFAAAVILPDGFRNSLLKDSKQLSAKQRELVLQFIKEESVAWSVASATAEEIDAINILNASILAMHRAIEKLKVEPQVLLIDGNRFKPYKDLRYICIVGGDAAVAEISAASVVAKCYRDDYMKRLAVDFPEYGWDKNMAYPTKKHREAILRYGTSIHHRKTFRLL